MSARAEKIRAQGNFLGAADLEPVPSFECGDELASFAKRIDCAGIQPGESATDLFDMKPAFLQISPVNIGNLQFVAR